MVWDLGEYSQHVAFASDSGIALTYEQLIKETEELKGIVGGRCLVFSLCNNSIGSVMGYVAFLNSHVVPLLLNSNIECSLAFDMLEIYRPAYIWIPVERISHYRKFRVVYEKYGYCLMKTDYGESYQLHENLGLLLTTSGSTGSPKLVRQTYDNIRTNARQIVQYLELDDTERPIMTLPMNYTYGCSIINSHLMVGATILLTEKSMMEKEFWDFMKQQRATSFGGVPYTYEMLAKLKFTEMDLPYLRTMTQAGGKLSNRLHEKFAQYAIETGKRFVVMYGACEATARMGYLPCQYALEKCGSIGIAIPGGKFLLEDIEGKFIEEPGVTGELIYQGKNVSMGYALRGDDLIKGDEWQGVYKTGDMAKRDEDGFYYIVGRKKRFLKIYGNRINLDEVEQLIKSEYLSLECACAGVDDHMSIFITAEEYKEDVKRFIAQKTGLNSKAFQIVLLEKIPKNDSGKTLYSLLEQYGKDVQDGV